MKTLLPLLFLGLTLAVRAADPVAGDFTGHYELAKKTNSPFALDVQQSGKSAKTSFSAGNADGSGAAPDGDGEGAINAKGELAFKWTDTFDNAGTGTLRREGKLYHLSLKPTKVTDPRAVGFYGEITLKQLSKKPQMSTR
jgi:hypothetical protein